MLHTPLDYDTIWCSCTSISAAFGMVNEKSLGCLWLYVKIDQLNSTSTMQFIQSQCVYRVYTDIGNGDVVKKAME